MSLLDDAGYVIRPAAATDAETYVAYLERNWARFRGAMPTADESTFATDTWRRRFAMLAESGNEPAGVSMLLAERGQVLADVTFSNIVYGPFLACHVGFKIDAALEGRGVMRAMMEDCCEMMFVRYRLHRIMANHRPENVRSAALLKRLGFREEGFARDYLHLDGAWRDHVLTSLVRPCAP